MKFLTDLFSRTHVLAAACVLATPATAGDFSVSPIRAELGIGTLSETITVTNHAKERLRVGVRLMQWTQDESGKDVYEESADLVYFPRQMELEPDAKRLVRVGAKGPAGAAERAYRLFIEEQPDPAADTSRAQIALYFRFGVPVFLRPAAPRLQPEAAEPTLSGGKISIQVRNPGNQNFRLVKLTFSDGAGYQQDVGGWYSLAGTQRTYTADIPRDVCRKASAFSVALEGEGFRLDRKLDVDPANCG